MAILSFAASALTMVAIVHGAALPQSLTSRDDAPSCLDKAQGTTFTWSPPNNEDASSIFQVICGMDYWGGDLGSIQADSFENCLEACSANAQCVSVAYGGTTCYMKNELTPALSNTGTWSAKRTSAKTGLTCSSFGSSDGTIYKTSKGDFKIVCGKDYYGNDLATANTKTFEACIETCATTNQCVDVSYINGACYLKHTATSAMDAAQVWTATLLNAQPYIPGLSCDNNKDDGKTYTGKNGGSYTIVCGTDYFGGDLSSLQTSTFEACMDACDSTKGCIDVSYTSGTCYMKNQLTTASTASWVWTGRLVTEQPLDLTQTQLFSINQPADTHIQKEKNLFVQTLTGTNPSYGISTMLWFPTIPYTVYEISFEYWQDNTQGQSYFLEVGDSNGYLATLGWDQTPVSANVRKDPSYFQALYGSQTGLQMNSCWTSKAQPQQAPASGSWQSGKVALYPRTSRGYFRRDNYGLGTTQWRNVYVRAQKNDYCGL
ncbi:hypothetical protein OPT61_g5729 [Boeremia exigua]|uniref:Uncharacterized protein n=1 Tax=Boeremia exigua TaxID=749465 RepID=A0ACC2I990_9PLEO|nr:hypothetical protein OPT61_g5729 [Boeremia exigua]